jgi:hypothetical protein
MLSAVAKSKSGHSRSAEKRRGRAAVLSQKMRHGDADAAFRLLQRRRALQGIAKGGWGWRLQLANAARLRKRQQRLEAAAMEAERQRLKSEYRLTDKVLATLRARFGGGFGGNYGENQCKPVVPVPGAKCCRCGWEHGNREPHVIAVP